jgi:DNA-binding transcriptional ArsR family regulator
MGPSAVADDAFHALANPTRRAVLENLAVTPATVSELAAPFAMQRPSFVQHLAVLERSRLVTSQKRGRGRTYELAPSGSQSSRTGWRRVGSCGKRHWTSAIVASNSSNSRSPTHDHRQHLRSDP